MASRTRPRTRGPSRRQRPCLEAMEFRNLLTVMPGKLAIRKIELDRPRLHIARGPDGRWSVSGILGIPDPSEPIPTIVIKHGTLVLEASERAPVAEPGAVLIVAHEPL